jgi:hypothetical protein
MRISYDRNPLHVKIFLDDKEKEIFKWKYIARQLEDDLFTVKYYLTDEKGVSIDKALEFCREISDIEKYAEEAVKALTEPHVGDCTAFPCSCAKCWAEDIIGLPTAPPSKMIGNALYHAFLECKSEGNVTENVLSILKEKQLKYPEYSKVIEYFEKYSRDNCYII